MLTDKPQMFVLKPKYIIETIMKKSDRYLKIVEWSDEDGCYIGRAPGLMLGGVHGEDDSRVYKQLCQVVEEWVEICENVKWSSLRLALA